jgi:hypothetical protein
MSSKKSSDTSRTPPIENLSKSSTDSSKLKIEDKSFKKTYRSYVSQIIVSARAADKIAQNEKSTDKEDAELKKAVAAVVSTTNKMKSTATLMEEKLRGNTKEIEALQLFHRSQPTWSVAGRRKRKFTSTDE